MKKYKDLDSISESIRHISSSNGYGDPYFDKEVKWIFSWDKALSKTISAQVRFTCLDAEAPFDYRVEPGVHIFSKSVGIAFSELGFDAKWGKSVQGQPIQVLRFLPADLRWQDDLKIESNVLFVRVDDPVSFAGEVEFIHEKYIATVFDRIHTPTDLAELILWGRTTLSKRENVTKSRYVSTQPFVFSSLLFIEDGKNERAKEVIEAGIEYYRSGLQSVPSSSTTNIFRLMSIKSKYLS